MTGIGAFFARESVPDFKSIMEPMINSYLDFSVNKHIEMTIIKPDKQVIEWDGSYKELDDDNLQTQEAFYDDNLKVGDLLIFSVGGNVRYFKEHQFVLANNSSNVRTISNRRDVTEYLDFLYSLNQRDMKRTLESCDQCDINLIACDVQKMNLMSAHDGHAGIQMCHAYIKGIGFFLHQNMVCLRNIIHHFTDCSQDAVNLWETWYGHPLEPEVIRETDLESGSMRKIKFNPKWSY